MRQFRTGLTLIELLMVLSLMTIAASIGAIGLAGVLDAADTRDVLWIVADADDAARSAALGQGPVELRLAGGVIVLIRASDRGRIGEWSLPATQVTIRDDQERAVSHVVFGIDGRCESYLIHSDNRVWRVSGRTGWIEYSGSAP